MTNITTTVIKAFVESFNNADKSSKALFSGYYNKAKVLRGDKKALNSLHIEYKTDLSKYTDNKAIINRFNRIINLANNYIELDIYANFDILYFYNIESLVNLMLYFKKEDTTSKQIGKKITKVFIKDISAGDYNNKMIDLIAEIKKEFKIIDSEKGFINLETQINKLAYSLSNEQKEKLIKLLQESIGK